MKPRQISVIISVAMLLGLAASAFAAGRKPNILVILTDDMGYGELTCQGNPQIPTPNIDSIAKNGIRFTNGYVTCPCCGPSRAGLITGRYQQRFGILTNHVPLPASEKTMGERFKAIGYVTGVFGKWHLGDAPAQHPNRRGFDEFFGFLGAAHVYNEAAGDKAKNTLMRGTQKLTKTDYLTDAFGREAAAFIEKYRNRPWLVYLPFNAVHGPLWAPEKYTSRFPKLSGKRKLYAGVQSAMDDAIGVVLAKIRQHNLEENTLIFFLSDNGGPTAKTTSSNAPLRGFKEDLLEGGIREPFMVQWKGRLPAGKVDDRPIISLDILPTALAAAGAPSGGFDGVNLLPYLKGEKTEAPHKALFWRYDYRGQWAVRMGDWKLHAMGKKVSLFNLAKDITEKHDLSAAEPQKAKELQAAYNEWNATNQGRKGKGRR